MWRMAMDVTGLVEEFISELLGLRSAYALTGLGDVSDVGDAEAVLRLTVRLRDVLLQEGWVPPAPANIQLERDRQLLMETSDDDLAIAAEPSQAEEHAVVRPRARHARQDAQL